MKITCPAGQRAVRMSLDRKRSLPHLTKAQHVEASKLPRCSCGLSDEPASRLRIKEVDAIDLERHADRVARLGADPLPEKPYQGMPSEPEGLHGLRAGGFDHQYFRHDAGLGEAEMLWSDA